MLLHLILLLHLFRKIRLQEHLEHSGAVEGAVAQGTAPTKTVVNLTFLNNSGSDTYSLNS